MLQISKKNYLSIYYMPALLDKRISMSDLKVNVGVRNINLKNFRGNKQLSEKKNRASYKETWDFVTCHRLTDVHISTKTKYLLLTYNVSHIFFIFFLNFWLRIIHIVPHKENHQPLINHTIWIIRVIFDVKKWSHDKNTYKNDIVLSF